MDPIVPLEQLEQIAAGIDHAEGICIAPDGTCYVSAAFPATATPNRE